MDDEQQRLMEIFNEARAKGSAEEREVYLTAACGEDAALRQQVETLLQAHTQLGDFLKPPADDLPPSECPGAVIGRYKLLEEIGEGAFGRVFMAEQTEPVRRKVALKIIKPGMDTRAVIARFEAERQAVALMDHPNIARVLDAGATEAGRPYFVMELVRGLPITEYCDRNNLPMSGRMTLFVKVCQAVQHAHQKGIIHRDLKPSNLMVTMIDGEPVPKIIDFGVAKALGHQLTERTLFTAFAQIIGTPAYMSPEQTEFSGVDVDTRSDIYSLGVLLYELLTGVTPLDATTLRQAALDEVRRLIREVEPIKPSTRLTQDRRAAHAATSGKSEIRDSDDPRARDQGRCRKSEIDEDLDWIVMKCLEKDRRRRYETAVALVEDIQRHLDHQPVLASPPSTAYRMRKFIRRHRVGVALSATAVAALLVGLLVAVVGFVQAREQRDRAVAAEQQAVEERDRALAAEARAEQNRREAENEKLKAQSEAARSAGLITVLVGQGRTNDAEGLVMQRDAVGDDETELGNSLGALAQTLETQDNWAGAEAVLREQLALQRKLSGESHPSVANSLSQLSRALANRGKLTEAEAVHRKALAMRREVQGDEHLNVAGALAYLAILQRAQGRHEEADTLRREALGMRKRIWTREARAGTEVALNKLAWLLATCVDGTVRDGRSAVDYAERAVEMTSRKKPGMLTTLAAAYAEAGQFAEAVAVQEEALGLLESDQQKPYYRYLLRRYESRMPYRAGDSDALISISDALWAQGKAAEAEAICRESLALARKTLGNTNQQVAVSLNRLGLVLERQDKLAEAEAAHRENLAFFREWMPDDHHSLSVVHHNLIYTLRAQFKLTEARPYFVEALALCRQRPNEVSSSVIAYVSALAGRAGEWADAAALYQVLAEADPNNHGLWAQAHAAALAAGQVQVSSNLCSKMLSRWGDLGEETVSEEETAWVRAALSVLLSPPSPENLEDAVDLVRRGFQANPSGHGARCALGMADYRQAQYEAAIEPLNQVYQESDDNMGCLAAYFYAMCLHKQGDTQAAQQVLTEANRRLALVLRTGELGDDWHGRCRHIIARSEAERLILGQEISPPVTADSLAATQQALEPIRTALLSGWESSEDLRWQEAAKAFADTLQDTKPLVPLILVTETGWRDCTEQLMGIAFIKAGDHASHEQLCRLLLQVQPTRRPGHLGAARFVQICFLSGSDLPPDLRQCAFELARPLEQRLRTDMSNDGWLAIAIGVTLYREGEYARAIEILQLTEAARGGAGEEITCRGAGMVFRAMALERLGRDMEAHELLAEAHELLTDPIQNRSVGNFWDLVICDMALEEATQLIDGIAQRSPL